MTRRLLLLVLFVGIWLGVTFPATAHEMRPAYLQITQVEPDLYQVLWKIPRRGELVIRLKPAFPQADELKDATLPKTVAGAMLYTYELRSERSLEGQSIYIDGLERTMVDVLVNVEYLSGEKASLMLNPDNNQGLLPGATSKWTVIKTYTILGVEHIWFGLDHLLFVLALILITKGLGKIIKTITAFTLAHSVTLSLAVLGFVNVPGPPVEAVIALSIVFLAMEIIKNQQGHKTLTSEKPWLVAFSFGLLHGLGFAGALAEVGLPQTEIPLALAFFNIGVELGQIAFVLVVILALQLAATKKTWPVLVKKVPAYAIGSMAAFWLIDRMTGFW